MVRIPSAIMTEDMAMSCRSPSPFEPRAMLSIITSKIAAAPVGKSDSREYRAMRICLIHSMTGAQGGGGAVLAFGAILVATA